MWKRLEPRIPQVFDIGTTIMYFPVHLFPSLYTVKVWILTGLISLANPFVTGRQRHPPCLAARILSTPATASMVTPMGISLTEAFSTATTPLSAGILWISAATCSPLWSTLSAFTIEWNAARTDCREFQYMLVGETNIVGIAV